MIDRPSKNPSCNAALRRRDFLISGVKATLCFIAVDSLGLRAFGQKRVLPKLPPDIALSLNDSVRIFGDYLTRYTLPEADFPANGSWKATYDLVDWKYVRKTVNKVFGQLVLTRIPASEGVTYESQYSSMIIEFETGLNSTMHCSSDRLPRLLDWETHYETHVKPGKLVDNIPDFGDWVHKNDLPRYCTAPPISLVEHGSHKDGLLVISTKLGRRHYKTDRSVIPQWILLDALRGAKADPSDPLAGVQFDLLHDLTSYRPHQRLRPVGVLQVTLPANKSFAFHGFVQTGFGTEPTHYWIDDKGRPVLITQGVIAQALTKIEAV